MTLETDIERAILYNSTRFKGKANAKAVLGTVLQLHPDQKSHIEQLNLKILAKLKEIESWPLEKQEERLAELPEIKFEKVKRELELPDVNGPVVMRFEPSPSGPMHLGHTYTFGLSVWLCKKHHGKLILRIADTNPENIDLFSYNQLPKDAEWLAGDMDIEFAVQSDRMHLYYAHAEQALEEGFAYVCTCDLEAFKQLLAKQQACPCRDLSPEEHIERWEGMLSTTPAGGAVVRIKTDLTHANPAMRDWPALRINTAPHPRQGSKYRVWPLMNFAVTIDDHEMGITHSIRAKDHLDNEKRAKFLFDHFGWTPPNHQYVGRINFIGLALSASETRRKIEAGEYSGWDDIRLPFLMALRRRGFSPKALLEWALSVGLTQTDKTVQAQDLYKSLNAANKNHIEDSPRRFIVLDPIKITITNAPSRSIELDLHPQHHKGGRHLKTHDTFYVDRQDMDANVPIFRLMECLNFKSEGSMYTFVDQDYATYKAQSGKIIHWLPVQKDLARVRVHFPDGTIKEGYGEPGLFNMAVGQLIQAERIGFMRLDAFEDPLGVRHPESSILHFWFAHP